MLLSGAFLYALVENAAAVKLRGKCASYPSAFDRVAKDTYKCHRRSSHIIMVNSSGQTTRTVTVVTVDCEKSVLEQLGGVCIAPQTEVVGLTF